MQVGSVRYSRHISKIKSWPEMNISVLLFLLSIVFLRTGLRFEEMGLEGEDPTVITLVENVTVWLLLLLWLWAAVGLVQWQQQWRQWLVWEAGSGAGAGANTVSAHLINTLVNTKTYNTPHPACHPSRLPAWVCSMLSTLVQSGWVVL